MSYTRDVPIIYEWSRCFTCGRYYAYEVHHDPGCANCARRRLDAQQEVINSQQRTIRSMKGALTKAKRR